MDISVYINELLYDHDCIIIPGFGGFICNYQPAKINSLNEVIYPPAKAVSFNRYLQINDGLLVQHIVSRTGASFTGANEAINAWVHFSQSLLKNNEEVILKQVGRFYNDAEGNLQFERDEAVNYLRSSYGLPVVKASLADRSREVKLPDTRTIPMNSRRMGRIAASVLLIGCIAILGELMWMGVEIKGLSLNQAGVASLINEVFRTEDRDLKPIPVHVPVATTPVEQIIDTTLDSKLIISSSSLSQDEPVVPATSSITTTPTASASKEPSLVETTSDNPTGYYIIVGVFKEEQNAEAAKAKLLEANISQGILYARHNQLTKVGYYVGDIESEAHKQLDMAHQKDATYWLMRKR